MIAVIDFYRIDDEHIPINASLLCIICEQYKDERVEFYSENAHINKLQAYWQHNNISVSNIYWVKSQFNGKTKKGIGLVFKRIQNELKHLTALVRRRTFKPERIFFLSLSSFSSCVYKLFFFRNVYTLITLHGDVEFIRMQNSFTRNMLGTFFRLSFQIKKHNCQYLALNKIVKDNLIAESYLNNNEVIAIYHPHIFKKNIRANDYIRPVTIAHIGIASMEKQAHYLYDIVNFFEQDINKEKLRFEIIGRNENIELTDKSNLIAGIKNNEMLERSEFEAKLEKIHYAIFFYNNNYQLTGSGALMDALDFEKPIIALRNQLFEIFFADAGKIGYLCDTVDEMKKVIKDIIEGKITEVDYAYMQLNMQNFKNNFSLSAIKEQLFTHANNAQVKLA